MPAAKRLIKSTSAGSTGYSGTLNGRGMWGSRFRKMNRHTMASTYQIRAVRLQVSTATNTAFSLKYPQTTKPATTRLQKKMDPSGVRRVG